MTTNAKRKQAGGSRRVSKKVNPAGADYTRPQAEELARQWVAAQVEREELVALRDAKMLEAAKPFAPEIDRIEAQMDTQFAMLQAWAEANLEEFGKAESVKLAGHQVGWRLGNHAARTKSKVTWKKVLETLLASPKAVRDRWIRTKQEPNKEAMIEDRETRKAELDALGVKIVQERRFYIDPAREGQDDKVVTS